MRPSLSLIGQRFGRYIVIDKLKGGSRWLCRCECGNERGVHQGNLLSGQTKGCMQCTRLPYGEASMRKVIGNYRKNALIRGLCWELSMEQCKDLFCKPCTYCNVPASNIQQSSRAYGSFVYSGLDRVDNSIGYMPGNVVPCCKLCNWMKTNLSLQEFKDHVLKVAINMGMV